MFDGLRVLFVFVVCLRAFVGLVLGLLVLFA